MDGYEVVTVYSGAEALEAGARARPQAVLLDIGMPGMSGYETARRIRLEAWGRHTVIIAVTGWGQDEDKRKAQAVGIDHHLTKPVDPDELDRLLGAIVDAAATAAETSAAPRPAKSSLRPTETT
jgi:CheY-like chemotaxis protein